MLEGFFLEQVGDPHVARRNQLLAPHRRYAEPDAIIVEATELRTVADQAEAVRSSLDEHGLAILQFASMPSVEEFKSLGEALGIAMKETDPSVMPYVVDGTVLNLVSEHSHSQKAELQPFSTGYLSLHSECSGRSANEQPRLIVLLCLRPGDGSNSSQTVLLPMRQVAAHLPSRVLQLLTTTRYRGSVNGPMIARMMGTDLVFSFRDFIDSRLEWVNEMEGEVSAEEVNDAIRALLAAMYDAHLMRGVHWRQGLLVVIDNLRFFHGRVSGSKVVTDQKRHLMRLRLQSR